MKNIIESIFVTAVRFFNNLLPKGNVIVFNSMPDFSGNSLAVFREITNGSDFNGYKTVWLVNNKETVQYASNFSIDNAIYKRSLLGLFYYCRAKLIFSTHGFYLHLKSKYQYHVELWHGIPFKKMGMMLSKPRNLKASENIDYFVSPSELTDVLFASCFHLKSDVFIRSNYPRNTFLTDEIDKDSIFKGFNIDIDRYKRVYCYMPTFREGLTKGKIEGRKFDVSNPFGVENLTNEQINDYLLSENILLLLKLHPFEEALFANFVDEYSNIRVISQAQLYENGLELYSLLGAVDVLVIDYSSVFFDFLDLQRPIKFFCPDMEAYDEGRGFLLSPLHCWLPGEIITKGDDFYSIFDGDEKTDRHDNKKFVSDVISSDNKVEISVLLKNLLQSSEGRG